MANTRSELAQPAETAPGGTRSVYRCNDSQELDQSGFERRDESSEGCNDSPV
jgi:hypothetical protein